MNSMDFSTSSRAFFLTCTLTSLMLAAATGAAAQPSLTVAFGRALNSMSSTEPMATDGPRTTGGSIEAEHQVADARLRLHYALDAGDYNTTGDWAYLQNEVGATWQARRAQASGPSIFAGAVGTFRSNGSSWSAADYRGIGLFLNAEWKPAETKTLRAGYRFDARAFADMPVLDQVEHEGFASALVNLRSRTTLIAEVQAGAKRYDVLDATPVTATTTAATEPGALHGRGAGAMSKAPTLVLATTTSSAAGSVSGTAGQVTVLGRVAQSLADRTGVTLQYQQRVSFGALPTAVVTTPALFFDDGVYDDPFASNAAGLRASLKHILQNGMALEAAGAWTGKDYRGTVALGADGLPRPGDALRADRIWRAGASWTAPILGERTGAWNLGLSLDYLFTRHQSNDAFYDFTSHAVGFGVKVAY